MPSSRHSVQRFIGILATLVYALCDCSKIILNLALQCLNFETFPLSALVSISLNNTKVQAHWLAATPVSRSACHLIDIWALSPSKKESQHPKHKNFLPKNLKALTSFKWLIKVTFQHLVIISYVLKRDTSELNYLIPHRVGKCSDSGISTDFFLKNPLHTHTCIFIFNPVIFLLGKSSLRKLS